MQEKFKSNREQCVRKIDTVEQLLRNGMRSLKHCVFQGIDFSGLDINWAVLDVEEASFLGCTLTRAEAERLRDGGAYIYASPKNLPYNPFRTDLYHWQELMEGYSEKEDNSIDLRIYNYFADARFNPPIQAALWQRVHDHAVDEALRELLQFDAEGMTTRKCVGFMGGHSTLRTDPFFKKTAETAKLATEAGYFVVSGGGPGIMEATNFGAYFAGRSSSDFEAALAILQKAPHYSEKGYHRQALEVLKRYPNGAESLAIPTWFYGHEPSNLFASHIAKYFSNSIREDTLLAISLYGVVYAPGSAGTTQEIFMDATQNHYGTFNYYSPMVFLGTERYAVQTMLFPVLKQLAWGKDYYKLLKLTDNPESVIKHLKGHPPVKKI